jgi:hypothetical protein
MAMLDVIAPFATVILEGSWYLWRIRNRSE